MSEASVDGKLSRVVTVCVGTPGKVNVDGKLVSSAIHKTPHPNIKKEKGGVWVSTLGLDGDHQVDNYFHGGKYLTVMW